MHIPAGWLGVIRGLGFSVVVVVLTYLGDASHLSAVLNPVTASLIATLALGIEHAIEGAGSGALFGSVNKNRG